MMDNDTGDTDPISEGGADDGMDTTTFELTREELRTTFEYQVQRLQEIDSKAIEILKANLLLIGIVVTGGSILVQTELDFAPFINSFTIVGGLLLLSSTGLAAVTYTASNLRGGIDAEAVEAAISVGTASGTGHAEYAFDERLLRSYAHWIDYNARVTAVNDMLATVTVLLVFVAFVYVVAGVVVAAFALSTIATLTGFVATTLVVGAFAWIAYHMDHIGAEPEQQPAVFEGIRLSKGTTRQEGWGVLREMVGRNPSESECEQ